MTKAYCFDRCRSNQSFKLNLSPSRVYRRTVIIVALPHFFGHTVLCIGYKAHTYDFFHPTIVYLLPRFG